MSIPEAIPPEPISQPAPIQEPTTSPVQPNVPKDIQNINQLADLNIPKGLLQVIFKKPAFVKPIPLPPIVTQFIAKMNVPLQQFAALMHKIQPIGDSGKPEQLAPKESSTQRDETSAKGGKTVEQNFVHIEVFKSEKGENQPTQQPMVPKEAKPEIPREKLVSKEQEGLSMLKEAKPETAFEKQPIDTKLQPPKEEGSQPTKPSEQKNNTLNPQIKKEPVSQEPVKTEAQTKQQQEVVTQNPAVLPQEKSLPPEKTSPKQTEAVQGIEKKESEKEAHQLVPKTPIETSGHHHGRRHLEDAAAIPIMHHKMYHSDDAANVPPWFNFFIQNDDDTVISRYGKKGSKKGEERQNPYKLSDMLFMILCGQLCGKTTLKEIIEFVEKNEPWFTVVLGLKHGLPPRQLLFWFLASLDVERFEGSLRLWLLETIGQQKGTAAILDIVFVKTAVGFIFGKLQGTSMRSSEISSIVEGLLLKNSIVLLKSDKDYGNAFRDIEKSRGKYIAEWNNTLNMPEETVRHESYLEGLERITVDEWPDINGSEVDLRVLSEFYTSQGIQKTERYYKSNRQNPSDEFFDVSRLQRNYENKFSWLANCALGFSSVSMALAQSQTSLKKIEDFAKEWIQHKIPLGQTMEGIMKEAASNMNVLLELTK